MTTLHIRACCKQYPGSSSWAIQGFNLSIHPGESVVLIGESGSGKTTLLRMIAGFETPTSGTILQGERVLVDNQHWTPPEQRQVGMLFQDYALFPHLHVLDNVMFGLHRLPRSQRKEVAMQALGQVQLLGYEARYPHTLSGGQQQRVALARALAPRPHLLLLDEPFSNLDVLVKSDVRDALFQIIRQTGISTLSVMHDIQDAMRVADRLLLLQHGCLVQIGSPQELYERPSCPYVARFMGRTNLLPVIASERGWHTEFGHIPMLHSHPLGHKAIISIRPEQIEQVPPEQAWWEGTVVRVGFAGRYRELQLQSLQPTHNLPLPSSTTRSILSVDVEVSSSAQVGDQLTLRPRPDNIIYFYDTDSV